MDTVLLGYIVEEATKNYRSVLSVRNVKNLVGSLR